MQELFRSKLGWDKKLTGDNLTKWIKLVDQLRSGPPLTLPRCSLSGPVKGSVRYQLYGFYEASNMAYAAVVYLGKEGEHGTSLSFMVAKTRVAPIKS